MSEKPIGIDALKTLPAIEVVRPVDEAIKVLTKKTKDAVPVCISYYEKEGILTITGDREHFVTAIQNEFSDGGYFFTDWELRYLYVSLSTTKISLFNYINHLFGKNIPELLTKSPLKRNSGISAMGILLDIIEVVKPDVATFDEKVALVVESIRVNDFQPFLLGAIVDDTIKLLPFLEGDLELTISQDEVKRFAKSYYEQATPQEKIFFAQGLAMTMNDLHLLVTGKSVN